MQTLYNLSNEEYHHGEQWHDYVSSSQLKVLNKSPKVFKYALANPQEQTEAMAFGSLFHNLMESMTLHNGDYKAGLDDWAKNYTFFIPEINPQTGKSISPLSKAYKESYAEFLSGVDDRTVVSKEDYETAVQMAYNLVCGKSATSAMVRKLLRWGTPEVSHMVEYEGFKFKFRTDLETPQKIVDWKTIATDDLSERSINNIIAKYGYDISAAMYMFLEHEQSGVWKTFYWCFVSKKPPYDVVLADASAWTYQYDEISGIVLPQVGAIKFKRLLDLYIKCSKEDEWPGVEINLPDDGFGLRIMTPTPPPWEVNYATNILEQSIQ